MNNKTKMSNLESFQELSIQISCLSMKIDKVLELLNEPPVTYEIRQPELSEDGLIELGEYYGNLTK